MAELEVDAQDVVRLMLQFCKENGLKDSLKMLPIELSFRPQSHTAGLAPYFREYLRGYMKGWIKEYEQRTGNTLDLYTGGLKIYTTINAEMQRNAEARPPHMLGHSTAVDEVQECGRGPEQSRQHQTDPWPSAVAAVSRGGICS